MVRRPVRILTSENSVFVANNISIVFGLMKDCCRKTSVIH